MRRLPDPRTWRGGRAALLCVVALALLLAPASAAASEPGSAQNPHSRAAAGRHGVIAAAPRPGDECDETAAEDRGALCNQGGGGGGGGGLSLGLVLAVLGGAVVLGVLLLIGAFLYFRRQAGPALTATEPGSEWWTCGKCGKSNMVGTPRCYACGAWQR